MRECEQTWGAVVYCKALDQKEERSRRGRCKSKSESARKKNATRLAFGSLPGRDEQIAVSPSGIDGIRDLLARIYTKQGERIAGRGWGPFGEDRLRD